MNIPCTPEWGYMDSPDFLALCCHIISIVATPIHAFGMYCIVFRTPDQMKTVKWYLLNLHVWILLFDYTFGTFTIPLLLIPEFVGYPLGILKYIGVPTLVQTLLALAFYINMIVSIVAIFENRFYSLCTFSWMKTWRFWRPIWLVAYYTAGAGICIPCFFLVPEQAEAKKRAFNNLPCLPSYIYDAPVFVLVADPTYHIWALGLFVLSTVIKVAFFVSCLAWNTLEQLKTKFMSQKTFDMQKKFFIALVIQMMVPLILFIFPLLYAFLSIVGNYYNQAAMNVAIVIVCTHGIVSTLVMIFVHRPYRETFFAILSKPKSVSTEVSQRGSNVQRISIPPVTN